MTAPTWHPDFQQEEDLIEEKRLRIEECRWAMHEANIQDFFEQYETPKTDKNGDPIIDKNGATNKQVKSQFLHLFQSVVRDHSCVLRGRGMSLIRHSRERQKPSICEFGNILN